MVKRVIFVGISLDWRDVLVSRTMVGISERLGLSVRTVEREMKDMGFGKWGTLEEKGNGVIWRVRKEEVEWSRRKG